jgi:hypothetical protein
MKKLYDLAVKTGTYQKDGETKNKYTNIGVIMENDEGKRFMLIDPLINLAAVKRDEGRDRVMVSMFEPKQKEQTSSSSPDTVGFEE